MSKVLIFGQVKLWEDLLFGIWDMFLHVVQCTLCDSFLENKVFQLMAVAVVFYSSCDFTEAI